MSDIPALLKEGKHLEAAAILRARGDLAKAMELYAQVWAYGDAAAVALELGDRVAALRYLLEARRPDDASTLRASLREGDPAEAARAAVMLEGKKMYVAAAELSEAAGDLEAAARQHGLAMDLVASARCLELLGRYREAGRAYEERLRDTPDDTLASLQLGRILLRFGRYEIAAKHLQAAAKDPAHRKAALRGIVVALQALGLAEGARVAFEELQHLDPTAPAESASLAAEAAAGGSSGPDEGRWLAGRYRIERLLGGGSVGRVYLAKDGFYDRAVAVKVFSASSSGADGRDAYSRFVREARVSAALAHPHIVGVFEFNADSAFLVMELMGGGTLEERLAREARLPLGVVRTVARGVLAALQAAHARGVVHRDIKPANIFFDAAGTVKLGDFGTAHLLDLGATQTGAFLGTLAYMSPEQITGGRVDASTDLYALAVVLYRLLTGTLPFLGPDFVAQHLGQAPDPPSARRPALGTAYDAFVARALAKVPAERFRSATEMTEALEALPWLEVLGETAASESAAAGAAAAAAAAGVVAPAEADRYETVADRGEGAVELWDRILQRRVLRVAAPPERLALYVRFARLSSPWVQAVLRIEQEAGLAWLELPGEPAPPDALAHPDVRRGLTAIHAAGLVHGALGARQVRVDEAGAVLLVDGATGQGTAAADLARLG